MTIRFDPYEELGVPRDATTHEIKMAYRRKVKETHPDADGDPEAFAKTSLALAVLRDEKRRKAFDDTGRVEDDKPDNDRAAAMQIIEQKNAELINAYITQGFPKWADPRRVDLPKTIGALIRAEIPTAKDGINTGENVLAFYRDLRGRFKRKVESGEVDVIARQLQLQIDQAESQIANLRLAIRVREIAIEIVEGYDFRSDEASWDGMTRYYQMEGT
jgi:curved DNA-binding protein CbpA